MVKFPSNETVAILNEGDIELNTGNIPNAKVIMTAPSVETTGEIFVKGSAEGISAQLTSLKTRLQSAQDEITTIKTEIASLLSAETDPQVGTVTDGKWCTANAGQVECTQEAPLAAAPSGSLLGFCSASCDGNGCRCGSATAPAICLSQACYCEDGYTKVSVNRGNTGYGYPDVILCINN